MLLKATYDSLDAVPEWARQLYKQNSSGKWEIQHAEIEGIAELSNPGLAANRDRFATEKAAAETRASEAERQRAEAERQLNTVRAPGTVILSADDAKAWQGFTALGDLKTVKKIVEEFPGLKKQVELSSQESLWQSAANDLGLNFDALKDQLTHPQRGDGLSIIRKQVDVEDTSNPGTKVRATLPFVVKREKVEGGGFKETETPLLEYAVNNWPAYAVQAMQAGAGTNGAGGSASGSVEDDGSGAYPGLLQPSGGGSSPAAGGYQQSGGQIATGVKLPVLGTAAQTTQGGGRQAGAIDANKLAQEFNAARNTRPNPLIPGGGSAAAGTGKT
jgi:hypothetical protein